MKLLVSSRLAYQLANPTDFIFQVHAAKSTTQSVGSEHFSISGNPPMETFEAQGSLNRWVRAKLPKGPSTVDYQAEVDFAPRQYDPATVSEIRFDDLPPETLVYLLPSRFCPSDLFNDLAKRQFGSLPRGYRRALAISDWVHETLRYVAGSTGPHSTAADALQQKQGVCRDFAHLVISLCRAAAIPARYVSVYADAMSPPDFHAVVEVYLQSPDGGAWFTLDPTHMSSAEAIARIAAGRDAADVAFAWTQGDVDSTAPQVKVSAPGRRGTSRTTQAVVGI